LSIGNRNPTKGPNTEKKRKKRGEGGYNFENKTKTKTKGGGRKRRYLIREDVLAPFPGG